MNDPRCYAIPAKQPVEEKIIFVKNDDTKLPKLIVIEWNLQDDTTTVRFEHIDLILDGNHCDRFGDTIAAINAGSDINDQTIRGALLLWLILAPDNNGRTKITKGN